MEKLIHYTILLLFLGSCASVNQEICRNKAWDKLKNQAKANNMILDPATFERRGIFRKMLSVREYWQAEPNNRLTMFYTRTRKSFSGRCK